MTVQFPTPVLPTAALPPTPAPMPALLTAVQLPTPLLPTAAQLPTLIPTTEQLPTLIPTTEQLPILILPMAAEPPLQLYQQPCSSQHQFSQKLHYLPHQSVQLCKLCIFPVYS